MATETPRRTDTPHLAEVIEIQRDGSNFSISIDGQEFPWFTAEDGVSLQVVRGIPAVTLTILAEDVRVLNKLSDV